MYKAYIKLEVDVYVFVYADYFSMGFAEIKKDLSHLFQGLHFFNFHTPIGISQQTYNNIQASNKFSNAQGICSPFFYL